MATRFLTRAVLSTTKPLTSVLFRSSTAAAALPNSSPLIFRHAAASYFRRLAPAISTRGFATRVTEKMLQDGMDLKHWLVVMDKPEGNQSRDEIIDSYVKTLAMVLGSEEEARRKIYSIYTENFYAFGALATEELAPSIIACPRVTRVLPDSYLDIKNKDYGGEPFVNGRVVPRSNDWARNKPKRENRRVPESQPSKTIKYDSALESQPSKTKKEDSALESQPTRGAWINEFKSCVEKLLELANSEIEVESPDKSISAAVKCLDEMEDFWESKEMYLDACEILKDAANRELFMCLAPEMRRRWLQRALDGGVEFCWGADERERFVSSPPEQQRRWVLRKHPVRQP